MYRTDFCTLGEGKGGMLWESSIETCILSMVKQITSPGWMHETSAQAWCTGKIQRDRVEREVGGVIGLGNTCKSKADFHVNVWQNPLQYCKVTSLQLIKINEKKKEIKRCLLLGRKVMTNLDSILKSRGITLSTKVHLDKAMVFPVVMYGCESWTIN